MPLSRSNFNDRVQDLWDAGCFALGAMHGIGWLHRDIKPPNIIVITNDFKFNDFGVSIKKSSILESKQAENVRENVGTSKYQVPSIVWSELDDYAALILTILELKDVDISDAVDSLRKCANGTFHYMPKAACSKASEVLKALKNKR